MKSERVKAVLARVMATTILIALWLRGSAALAEDMPEAACPVGSKEPCVVIDHTSGVATYVGYSLSITLQSPSPVSVPLRPGDSLNVVIEKTNPLIYSTGQEVTEEEFVDKTALFKYLAGVQGAIAGLVALSQPFVGEGAEKEGIAEATRALVNALENGKLYATLVVRLDALYLDAIQASEAIEAGQEPSRARVRSVMSKTADWYPFAKKNLDALKFTEALKVELGVHQEKADEARKNLDKALEDARTPGSATGGENPAWKEAGKALAALAVSPLDLGREVDRLILKFRALDRWQKDEKQLEDEVLLDAIGYKWDKTQKVTITVEKKKAFADAIAYRDRKFEKVTFVVNPEWWLQPSIGAGFIWADKLVWPEWVVQEADGKKTVASKGDKDERFQFFPLISLAMRPLSCTGSWYGRTDAGKKCGGVLNGSAVTLDLGWNASTSEPAYLAGASLVFSRQFKIGAGVVWQRREVLDGIAPGDPVPASGIPLRQSYPPAPYLMFSILGWPPFTAGQ